MKFRQFFLVSCVSLLWLETAVAVGDINNANSVAIINTVKGNVNIYSSKEEIDKIIAVYAKRRRLDTEQIKPLTTAVTALIQGKGISATKSQIKGVMGALAQGNTGSAEDLFEKEAQRVDLLAKQAAEAYRNLGALAHFNDPHEALQAYRRATELDPDNAEGWNQLGFYLFFVGDLDSAIAAFSRALTLSETHQDKAETAVAVGNLGLIYFKRGDLDKAIEFQKKALTYHEALGSKEGMAKDYINLGIFYYKRLDLDKAIEFHQKALMLHLALGSREHMAKDYGFLGIDYYTRGDLDKAIVSHQKALTLNSSPGGNFGGMAENYFNLGITYKKRGNLIDGFFCFWLSKIVMHMHHPESIFHLLDYRSNPYSAIGWSEVRTPTKQQVI